MADRPAVRRIRASTEPVESVRLWGAMAVHVAGRTAPPSSASRACIRGLSGSRPPTCWLLNDPLQYRRLVLERGWPVADYQHWLFRAVAASLLEPDAR